MLSAELRTDIGTLLFMQRAEKEETLNKIKKNLPIR